MMMMMMMSTKLTKHLHGTAANSLLVDKINEYLNINNSILTSISDTTLVTLKSLREVTTATTLVRTLIGRDPLRLPGPAI